jgi:hypothetical protein
MTPCPRPCPTSAAFAFAFAFAGCVEDPGLVSVPRGDVEVFAADVQPVVDARCADPTCHGRPERPLSLYSPGRYRLDPARTFIAEPLTAEELEANARSMAAFAADVAPGGVDLCLVLRKPLAVEMGGCGHEGGVAWTSRDDREYRAVRSWLGRLIVEEAP